MLAEEGEGCVAIAARERPLRLWFDDADEVFGTAGPLVSAGVSTSGSEQSIGKSSTTEQNCSGTAGRERPLYHQWATRIVDARLACEPSGVVRCAERFQLAEVLGTGAYASVHRATCLTSGRACAVKVVRRPLFAMTMVEKEAAVLRVCQGHPNVVRLIGSFADARHTAYLVLELLPGGDLFEQVVSKYQSVDGEAAEGYTEDGVRAMMRMALSALDWIHSKSVLHRDLKPENVLLLDRRGGNVDLRVCDFGEALLLPVAEKLGSLDGPPLDERIDGEDVGFEGLVGTRGYMAPEVLEGKGHCFASDIWSLGVILYILLCGQPPFSADDEKVEADLVLKGRWGFTASSWRNISPAAKQLIQKMLHHDPACRPSAAAALRHEWTSMPPAPTHPHALRGVGRAYTYAPTSFAATSYAVSAYTPSTSPHRTRSYAPAAAHGLQLPPNATDLVAVPQNPVRPDAAPTPPADGPPSSVAGASEPAAGASQPGSSSGCRRPAPAMCRIGPCAGGPPHQPPAWQPPTRPPPAGRSGWPHGWPPPSWPPQVPPPAFPAIAGRVTGAEAGSSSLQSGEHTPGDSKWEVVRASKSLIDVVQALGGYTALRRRDSFALPQPGMWSLESPRTAVPTSNSLPPAAMKASADDHGRLGTSMTSGVWDRRIEPRHWD